MKTRPIAVDLFCGAGGMSLGFEQAGFDVVLAVDKDPYHVAAHHRNFPYGKTIMESVAELTSDKIFELIGTNEVDLIYGGPPCQGFSTMGSRNVCDPRNSLVDHFCRVIGEVKPKFFVMENVPGMNTGSTSSYFDLAIFKLKSFGYEITWPVETLNAKDFGVPQSRERLFIIGVRSDLGIKNKLKYPKKTAKAVTVKDAFEGLPIIDNYPELFKSYKVEYPSNNEVRSAYARRARGLEQPSFDYSRPRVWDNSICSGCVRTRHNEKTTALYQSTSPGNIVPGHKLPRLSFDGISPTLRAGTDSERGSHTAPRPVHPQYPRVISIREAARLHGYPDWFSFYPRKLHAYRQIGNSVCPPVSHAIGLEIIRLMEIDPSLLSKEPVILSDEFKLSEDRPKTKKRIPIKEEFPKIINWLWNKYYEENKSQNVYYISVGDIEVAIKETEANLPRVSPQTFLRNVSKFRHVRDLLKLPLSYGYTIRLIGDNGDGEFIPLNHPGDILNKKAIEIRTSDIKNAQLISNISFTGDEASIIEYIENEEVTNIITNGQWLDLSFERDLFGFLKKDVFYGTAKNMDEESFDIIAIVLKNTNMLDFDKIKTFSQKYNRNKIIVISMLTNQHIYIGSFSVDENLVCIKISSQIFNSANNLQKRA